MAGGLRSVIGLLLILAVGLGWVWWGGASGGPAPLPPPATAPPSSPDWESSDPGSLTVEVRWLDLPPPPKQVTVSGPLLRADGTPAPIPMDETVVVNPNGTLRNVLVWAAAGLPEQEWPAPEQATLEAIDYRFEPHVLAICVKQRLIILNRDPVNCDVRIGPCVGADGNEELHRMLAAGEVSMWGANKHELGIPVRSDLHGWMRGVLHVLPHPFFGVTDGTGRVVLKGLPPGDYDIDAWHETLGVQRRRVRIAPGSSGSTVFRYPTDDPAPAGR